MSGFAWLPPDDSDRLEEEERWVEEHGPIGAGVLSPEQHAAMLDVYAGDDDEC